MGMACMVYGGDSLAARVRDRGIDVIQNVSVADCLPPGEGTDAGCHPMYARLIVPEIFGDSIWMDADQVFRSSADPLMRMEFEQAFAARPTQYTVQRDVRDTRRLHYLGHESVTSSAPSFYSGLMRFNAQAWKDADLTQRCVARMARAEAENIYYRFVVQSVVAVEVDGWFARLDPKWQGFVNENRYENRGARVLHWHGRKKKPWDGGRNTEVWRAYHCMYS